MYPISSFNQAAVTCASLRDTGYISTRIWSSSHSDNDGDGAVIAVGAMAGNPTLNDLAGYACDLR